VTSVMRNSDDCTVVGLSSNAEKDFPTWQFYSGRKTLPYTIALGCLLDGRLRMEYAVDVILERGSSGLLIAHCQELNEFGCGCTTSEAIADLQHCIAELYFALKADSNCLGSGLTQTWKLLRTMITEYA